MPPSRRPTARFCLSAKHPASTTSTQRVVVGRDQLQSRPPVPAPLCTVHVYWHPPALWLAPARGTLSGSDTSVGTLQVATAGNGLAILLVRRLKSDPQYKPVCGLQTRAPCGELRLHLAGCYRRGPRRRRGRTERSTEGGLPTGGSLSVLRQGTNPKPPGPTPSRGTVTGQ